MRVNGLNKVKKELRKVGKQVGDGVLKAVNRSLFIVEGKALELVSGDMRAVDTGLMRSTLTHYISVTNKDMIYGEIGYCTHYALAVHEGYGMHGGNPRPTLTAALTDKRKTVVKIIRNELKKRLSGKS